MSPPPSDPVDDGIELSEIFARLRRGLPLILGLGCAGAALVVLASWGSSRLAPLQTSTRVAFSFPGVERGEYPDDSKFDPDDLRAPDVVAQAVKRMRLTGDEQLVSSLRSSLVITGLISPNVSKERDRLRAAGQPTPPFFADEYEVSLLLPRGFPLSPPQREQFLNESLAAYRERFQQLHAEIPVNYGAVFAAIQNGDSFEYDIALTQEIQNLRTLLGASLAKARAFRSPSTGLSFRELSSRLELFSQLKVSQTLALVNRTGFVSNRVNVLSKLDYYINTLTDEEHRLTEEEQVIKDLLSKAQDRGQSYVLSSKTQADLNKPVVTENVLDTLVANDSYNFLIRKAFEAGTRTKQAQIRKEQAIAIRKRVESFSELSTAERTTAANEVHQSLAALEADYNELIKTIRLTYQDYARQEFADVVRMTMTPVTGSGIRTLVFAASGGLATGLLLGVGLSLLGISGRKRVSSGH